MNNEIYVLKRLGESRAIIKELDIILEQNKGKICYLTLAKARLDTEKEIKWLIKNAPNRNIKGKDKIQEKPANKDQ